MHPGTGQKEILQFMDGLDHAVQIGTIDYWDDFHWIYYELRNDEGMQNGVIYHSYQFVFRSVLTHFQFGLFSPGGGEILRHRQKVFPGIL